MGPMFANKIEITCNLVNQRLLDFKTHRNSFGSKSDSVLLRLCDLIVFLMTF